MSTIYLGNTAAVQYKPSAPDDDGQNPERLGVMDGATVTTIRTSPDSSRTQTLSEVLRIWDIHSDAPPAWIECDDPILVALLLEEWGDIPTMAPEDVEATHYSPDGPAGDGARSTWPVIVAFLIAFHLVLFRMALHLRTNAGRDHQSAVVFDTASNGTGTYASTRYIGVTEDATAPAAGDTALTSELAVEGFTRATATYAHTAGTATVTLTKTFTMSGGTSRTIRHAGLFNATSGGTMGYKTAVPSAPTLVSGDSVAITWTFTL